jgi:nicotinamidase-related amidase
VQIRMRHPNPGTRSSFAGPPDVTGGCMVDMEMLDVARAHGWTVAHIENERPEPKAEAPAAALGSEGPQAESVEDAKPANGASKREKLHLFKPTKP